MRLFNQTTLVAAVAAATLYLPLNANAALFGDDEARQAILELRSQVEALQRNTQNGTISLADQSDQLNQQIAQLRGQVELLTHQVNQLDQRQKDFYNNLDARLRKLEPQTATIDGQQATVAPEETKAYNDALNLFKAGNYAGADTALNNFIKQYPQSGYLSSVQYWLGNVQFAREQYRSAISTHQALIKNHPDSTFVPDALLSIASSYVELKDNVNAKKTLNTLISKYPDSTAAQQAKDKLTTFK